MVAMSHQSYINAKRGAVREWLRQHLTPGVRARLRSIQSYGRHTRVRIARFFSPPPLPKNPNGAVYLNLGCGTKTHPAFVNVDARADRHIHYVRPIDDLTPFASNSVDLVYASHCLEHFGHHHTARILAEWFRVLKPGGILRLGVPDFDQLLAAYRRSNDDMASILYYLMGYQSYPLNCHYTMFTRRSLTGNLLRAGFREVRTWEKGTDELTSIEDCTAEQIAYADWRMSFSLNLEAVK